MKVVVRMTGELVDASEGTVGDSIFALALLGFMTEVNETLSQAVPLAAYVICIYGLRKILSLCYLR